MELKKYIKIEIIIESKEMKIVILSPLIKNSKFEAPVSSLGFNIYQPQL